MLATIVKRCSMEAEAPESNLVAGSVDWYGITNEAANQLFTALIAMRHSTNSEDQYVGESFKL